MPHRLGILLMALLAAPACDDPAASPAPKTISSPGASSLTAASSQPASTPASSTASASTAWQKRHAEQQVDAGPAPKVARRANAMHALWEWDGARVALVRPDGATIVKVEAPQQRIELDDQAGVGPGGQRHAVWSEDGSMLATAAATVVLWNTADGRKLHDLGPASASTTGVRFSHDGRRLATLTQATIAIWRLGSGAPEFESAFEGDGSFDVVFLPDNKHVAGTNFAGVTIWDVRTGKPIGSHGFKTGGTSPVGVSPAGTFAASAEEQHRLVAWKFGEVEQHTLETVGDCGAHLSRMHFGSHGQTLLTGSEAGWMRSWNLPTLTPRSSWTPPTDGDHDFESAYMSHDGGIVVRVLPNRVGEIWDAFKNTKLANLEGGIDEQWVSFSADSRYLAVAIPEPTVWSAVSGKRLPI